MDEGAICEQKWVKLQCLQCQTPSSEADTHTRRPAGDAAAAISITKVFPPPEIHRHDIQLVVLRAAIAAGTGAWPGRSHIRGRRTADIQVGAIAPFIWV